MNNILDFTDQTVLITGATKGIGKSAATLFYERGAQVIVTGTSKHPPDEPFFSAGKDKVIYCQADFSSKKGIHDFLVRLSAFPKIDVCVNNAGINILSSIEEVQDTDYETMLSVNQNAPLAICKQVSGLMRKQQYGRIVNIASIWSILSKARRTTYSITKNAIVGLTKNLSVELASFGIMVNAVSPGFTMTELTRKNLSQEEINLLSKQVPAKRFANPVDIAHVILFLASSENSYLTGQNIIVDGGFTNV
jgi:3-oxoacyl-[acyl-carrier protein] reductase